MTFCTHPDCTSPGPYNNEQGERFCLTHFMADKPTKLGQLHVKHRNEQANQADDRQHSDRELQMLGLL